jgi:acetyl-CoA C-acetyltransferase
MREVAVISTGLTAFGAFPERTIRDLGAAAGRECLESCGLAPSEVDGFYLGCFAGPSFTGQNHLAPWVASAIGLEGVPATRFEAACASSGAAFAHAWAAVAGGLQDVALVVGVESMTGQTTARTTEILASAGEMASEVAAGATFPALFALIARRHMYELGTTREHLAAVAVKNHANGALNPHAHLRKAITIEQALNGRPVADPLTLYDCSLISDGAAAVLLAPAERARELTAKPVRVLGVAQASDRLALADKADITSFPAVRAAARRAYAMAGVGAKDIDFAEVHDCFTIAELVALEDLGLFARGQAGPATLAGETVLRGGLPINPSGGLKSKGHPVGATGAAQIVEVVRQLRGECGERQLGSPRIGLTQNLGGSGATALVGIFGE